MRLLNCALVISAKPHCTASGDPLNMESKKGEKKHGSGRTIYFMQPRSENGLVYLEFFVSKQHKEKAGIKNNAME